MIQNEPEVCNISPNFVDQTHDSMHKILPFMPLHGNHVSTDTNKPLTIITLLIQAPLRAAALNEQLGNQGCSISTVHAGTQVIIPKYALHQPQGSY